MDVRALLTCAVVAFAFSGSVIFAQTEPTPAQPEAKDARPDKEGDGRPVTDLRQFMRAKLAASNQVLEGLATEDMALVRDGARALNKMSLSEKWRASNDVMYKQFSAEFQRVTIDLAKAAENDNLDLAALKWMGATMACIECHRFVRTALVVDRSAFKPEE